LPGCRDVGTVQQLIIDRLSSGWAAMVTFIIALTIKMQIK